MAKRRKKGYRRPRMKIALLPLIGMLMALANIHRAGNEKIHGGSTYFSNAGTEAGRILLGVDNRIGAKPKFNAGWLWEGTFPILFGVVGHKIAGKVGVNKAFSKLPINL